MGEEHALDYFSDVSVVEDPLSYYEYARAQGPVWREPYHGSFVVTGYDEMMAVYRDLDTFSSCNSFGGPFPPLPEDPAGDDASELIEKYRDIFPSHESLITFDPPLHNDHRGLDDAVAHAETAQGERGVHVAPRRPVDRRLRGQWSV